jgi:tRNA wybutosine-synthesizing protein 2
MMKPFKQFLKKGLGIDASFQVIGDIIVISASGLNKDDAERILKESGAKTVCMKAGGIRGDKRKPSIRKLCGNGTETVHTENGCKYMLDVTKVMFSRGNVNERSRPAKQVKPGEAVLDMFAGIGYFSVPIAKACPSCKVISVDVNPVSISYLTNNIRLNKVKNIQPVVGDCMKMGLEDMADRILMGYLPGTDRFLPAAFRALKKKGIIHFHDVYRDEELWDRPIKILEEAAKRAGYRMEKVLYKGKVKQYSPRKQHIVIDALFVRA